LINDAGDFEFVDFGYSVTRFGEHGEKFKSLRASDKESFVKFLKLLLDIANSQVKNNLLSQLNTDMSLKEIIAHLKEFKATLEGDETKGGLDFKNSNFKLQADTEGGDDIQADYSGMRCEITGLFPIPAKETVKNFINR